MSINIRELKEKYGIALVAFMNKENPTYPTIAEIISEDGNQIIIKNPATISPKTQFNQLVDVTTGLNNPLVTLPKNFNVSPHNVEFLDNSNQEISITLSDNDACNAVNNLSVIQQYIINRG